MSTARLAGIPIDHVIVEVTVFPLTAEAALERVVTEFDPTMSPATNQLWRAAEQHLLNSFPAFSIEEAVTIRDNVWFANQHRGPVPLWRYVRLLARLFLERRGNEAIPVLPTSLEDGGPTRHGSRAAQARRLWRWMSFAIPPDLLLAAFPPTSSHHGADADLVAPDRLLRLPGAVEVVSPVLDRLLKDRGYAETHCHMGAALDFPVFWVSTLRALADPALKPERFQSPGAVLREGKDLGPWLIRAALARYVLAAYLQWGRAAGSLEQFLFEQVIGQLTERAGTGAGAMLILALSDLKRGRLGPDVLPFADWQALYAQLTGLRARPFPDRLEHVQDADPIAGFFPSLGERRPTPEMRLVAEGLAHLAKGTTDPAFAALFWQTIRVRTLFYRHVVQRPMTPGLQWFIRFYSRIGAGRRPLEQSRLLLEAAAERGGAGSGLRSLELRTSPNPAVTELWGFVKEIDQSARRRLNRKRRQARGTTWPRHRCEFGLVLHFTKDRGGGALKGSPVAHGHGSHADPDDGSASPSRNPSGYRYASFYAEKRKEALSFAWLLCHFPLALEVVRGLDLCTDELGVPNWVLTPLIDYVRQAGHVASSLLRQQWGLNVPPLNTTVHVGEDFIHLQSGLRRIDEALRYLNLREGDRIGHGLALGIEPGEWSRRAGRIPLTSEERLFDLVWEWNWYASEGGDPPSGRRHVIGREITRLAGQVFGERLGVDAYNLDKLVGDLYDVTQLRRSGFPAGPSPSGKELSKDPYLNRLCVYLTDRQVFLAGRAIEWVDPSSEGEVLAVLQAGLRRKVAERGVTVEVNPSSNLLIGDLQDLARHPFWRLRPPRPSDKVCPVSICIGSDDPLTFATSLREEYQLVHDALLLAGLSEEEGRRWLERTRASGLETRFTLPRTFKRSLRSLCNLEAPGMTLPP